MAKCYKCGTKFIGKEENNFCCPDCGEEPTYVCPDCKNEINKKKTALCKKCGFFICEVCKSCSCNSLKMGWNSSRIFYSIDKKDETIAYIGYKHGRIYKSYIRLHNEEPINGDKTVQQILEAIIQIARNQKAPVDVYTLCPRKIAITNILYAPDSINNMMQDINLEENGTSTTMYKELIAEIRNLLKKYKTYKKETFTIKNIINDLTKSRRRELDKDKSATRRQVETAICQGLIEKVVIGGVTQEHVYELGTKKVCEYWDKKEGIVQCVCPKEKFSKWKHNGKSFIKAEDGKE